MNALVAMVITCWMAGSNSELVEVWRIEQTVTLEHCIAMNKVSSGGGPKAAITVTCGRFGQGGALTTQPVDEENSR